MFHRVPIIIGITTHHAPTDDWDETEKWKKKKNEK